MKFLLIFGLLFALVATCSAADDRSKTAPTTVKLFDDPVLARGKNFEIRASLVEAEFTAFKANIAVQGGSVSEDKRAEFEEKILDRLVVTRVLLARANDADRKTAGEKADKIIEDSRKRLPTEESFKRQLRSMGLTLEEFRTKLLERAIAEEVFVREVKSQIPVEKAEIEKYYRENPQLFEAPEMVRASHILISTRDTVTRQELAPDQKKAQRQLAEKLLAQARKGEDFAKLAKENSDDPNSKNFGGSLGDAFPRGRFRDAPEFEATVFSLSTNQVSELVTSAYGFHIIKVTEKIPAQKKEMPKAETDIRDALAQREAEKQMPAYLEKVKKEAGVEFLKSSPKP